MRGATLLLTYTLRATLGGCGFAAAACSGDATGARHLAKSGQIMGVSDSTDAIAPSDVRVADGVVWVVDKASERVVALDSALGWRQAFGRAGSGPGELRGALRLRVRDSLLVVSELGNGRLSAFSLDGRFLGAVRMPYAAGSFDLDGQGRILSVQRSESHYLTRLSLDGTREDFAPRDPKRSGSQSRGSDGRLRFLGADLVVVLPGDSVLVLDNLSAEMLVFTPDGRLARARKLETPLAERLLRYRAERVSAIERTRRQVWSAPLVKDMWVAAPGMIALLTPVSGSELILHPSGDGELASIGLRTPNEQSLLRTAVSAALHADQLILVGDSGVTRHRKYPE